MSDKPFSIGYDAEEYSAAKRHPWRLWIERWSILSTIHDLGVNVANTKAGDFGCGTGLYSRMLIDQGASSILAIDGDSQMIATAKKEGVLYNDLITYQNSWIQNTNGKEDCHLILGAYLMSYPKSREEATAYCQAIASHLTREGVFIGVMSNPFVRHSDKQYQCYGFSRSHPDQSADDYDGRIVHWHFEGMTDPAVNYNLYPATYEQAFLNAGMKVQWRNAELHPSQKNNPFWHLFFQDSAPINLIIARKIAT
ncbi:class I SAM-dependent methyltransferase [Endozoicomonas ascidiicola]|uniref:class I SAM-dependent methyltransferase n=1 Tax=Endozoicomonas ascidiicola TaxID=1698521 RepID=UPI00083454A8|nr:class I SAM-dependent methyltransferase [Endozoicomonas ascidiicola]